MCQMACSEGSTDGSRRAVEENACRPQDSEMPPASGKGDVDIGQASPGAPPVTDAANAASPTDPQQNGGRRKRNRRKHKGGRHHRKWKPYSQMTWDERSRMDERETRRANQKRQDMFAAGQAMAPYNTTQFLMDQHDDIDRAQLMSDLAQNDQAELRPHRENSRNSGEGGSASQDSSDEYYDSPNDEEIFLEKDFTEAYANYHAERLQTLSKEELIKEHLELEGKIERLEKRGKEKRENNDSSSDAVIAKLKEENSKLKKENYELKKSSNMDKTET